MQRIHSPVHPPGLETGSGTYLAFNINQNGYEAMNISFSLILLYYSITYIKVKTHSKKKSMAFDRKTTKILLFTKIKYATLTKAVRIVFSISAFLWGFSRKCTTKQFNFSAPEAGMLINETA